MFLLAKLLDEYYCLMIINFTRAPSAAWTVNEHPVCLKTD